MKRALGALKEWGGWILAALLFAFTLGRFGRSTKNDEQALPPRQDSSEPLRDTMRARSQQDIDLSLESLRKSDARARDAERTREEVKGLSTDDLMERSRAYAKRKRKERNGGALAALILAASVAPSVRAEDVEEQRHPKTGAAGVWVSEALWRDALADAESLVDCEGSLIEARASAVRGQSAAKRLGDLETACARERKEDDARFAELMLALRKTRAERDAWFRSPWLAAAAFAAGVASGGYAISQL